jgi:hypothetical protein
MHRTSTAARLRAALVAACAAASWGFAQGALPGFTSSPFDLSARVQDIHNPGGTVFDDHHDIVGANADPKQTAEYLYHAPVGQNFSGHSRNITSAFASSMAESNGNGGVGVSSWIAFDAVRGTQATDSLVAQAQWDQSFSYLGSQSVQIDFHFEIPAIIVGLIGVSPNRDGPNKTERAYALVRLTSFVVHGDGSRSETGGFELGLSVDEYQIPLGPGIYENYADLTLTSTGFPLDVPLHFTYPDDPYNPEWTLLALSGNKTIAALNYGDALVYQYSITATGSTRGGEHGYDAFIGDPFGVNVTGGGLVVNALPVPEPQEWLLLAAGLVGLSLRGRNWQQAFSTARATWA